MTIAKTVMTFFILCTFCFFQIAHLEKFAYSTHRLYDNASVIEYANSEDAQFEKETFYLFIFSQIIGIKYVTDWCTR